MSWGTHAAASWTAPTPPRRTNTPCSVPLSSSGTSSPPDRQSCTSTGRSIPDSETLPLFVHPSSERLIEPVRQDSSFAEKQESHPTRLLVVQGGRAALDRRRARSRSECGSG